MKENDMAKTPKSERQAEKAAEAVDRWSDRASAASHDPSGRFLADEGHPAFDKQEAAFDRYRAKHAHNSREYHRKTGRDLRSAGWDVAQRADGSWQCAGYESGPREGRGEVITPCQSFKDYERAESIWRRPAHGEAAAR